MCAGPQNKWNNYMNIPKQMAPIFGVPLLQRTVQAMNKMFPDSSVYIAVQDQSKKEFYIVDGKYEFYVPALFDSNQSSLRSLVPLFKETDDDFLVLMGDVTFSQDCLDKIYKVIKREQSKGPNKVKVFGRKSLCNYNYHKNGELFAFYIPHQAKSKLIKAIEIVDEYYNLNLINRKFGWVIMACYYSKSKKLSEIKKLHRRKNLPASSFITIDDETEDFDIPNEYIDYTNRIEREYRWVTSKSWRNTTQVRFIYFRLLKMKATINKWIIVAASTVLPKPVKKLAKKLVGWDKFYSNVI